MPPHPGQRDAGFTVIELISVLLILGIVAAVAFPLFNTSSIDVEEAASIVQADIQLVHELAMARNQPGVMSIVFNGGQSSYTIPDPAGIFNQTRQLPDGVTITAGGTISFNRFGEKSPLGSTTIELTAGANTQTVTVETVTGRVSVP